MKFPIGATTQQKKFLKKIYEDTYRKNEIIKGSSKAKNIATARFYEEVFKMFKEQEGMNYSRKKRKPRTYIKEEVEYKSYKVNGNKFIVSTEEKLLNKFFNAERKGLLKNMEDEFELEVFNKATEQYPDISFSPEMYYVIK